MQHSRGFNTLKVGLYALRGAIGLVPLWCTLQICFCAAAGCCQEQRARGSEAFRVIISLCFVLKSIVTLDKLI